ncbi:MAG: RnfABCDGE type electron transport complex subunit D, partial [Marinifilum sp.]|nr:RnfABCDGE type electron transport complex subunit D [Marinifilum sp.]
SGYIDVETGATPLAIIKEGLNSGQPLSKLMSEIPSNMDLFLGNMGGSMGEIAGAALVLGLIYMLIRKIITWHIPVSVIGSVAIFTGILHMVDPEAYAGPLFHILTGGLLLGGIFMATDYVTSPMSNKGMIIYGIGIGVLTVVIRVFGAYPEGVSFAILIMNAFVPLINVYVKPKRFGEKRK